MDIVFINDLKVDAVIGVYAWERKIHQTLVFNLEMGWDISGAAGQDDIELALNYKAVSDRIISFVQATEFALLETLAEQLAALLRDEFSIPWLRLRIAKPGAVPAALQVGLLIERGELS